MGISSVWMKLFVNAQGDINYKCWGQVFTKWNNKNQTYMANDHFKSFKSSWKLKSRTPTLAQVYGALMPGMWQLTVLSKHTVETYHGLQGYSISLPTVPKSYLRQLCVCMVWMNTLHIQNSLQYQTKANCLKLSLHSKESRFSREILSLGKWLSHLQSAELSLIRSWTNFRRKI